MYQYKCNSFHHEKRILTTKLHLIIEIIYKHFLSFLPFQPHIIPYMRTQLYIQVLFADFAHNYDLSRHLVAYFTYLYLYFYTPVPFVLVIFL